jgi:hypothetical protein
MSMKYITFAALLAVLFCFAPGTAYASYTWTGTASFDWTTTELNNNSISLQQFNAAVVCPSCSYGLTLLSVEYTIDGGIRGTINLKNTGSSADSFNGQTSSTLKVWDNSAHTGTKYINDTLAFQTGSQTIAAGATYYSPTLTSLTTGDGETYDSGLITTGLSGYVGTGTFATFYFSTVTFSGSSGGGGNAQTTASTQAKGWGEVTYTYLINDPPPGSTPEPFTLGLLGSGLVGLGLLGRKRFAR